ncbi:MAG: hypothetical protein ABSG80_11075 [Verrucomicrobiota bacterium]|jgi:hypothetical protein
MKSCEYCGKQYADDVAVCPVDGQPVINQEEKQGKLAVQPKATKTAFNVKLVSPLSSAGKYRIFVERSDLLFIQIEGGSRSVLEAAAPFIGPAGNLIPLTLWLFGKRKTKAKLQRLEEGDPEELLRESENNFKLNLAEIRDAAIEAPAFFQTSGKAGRLNFSVRHGEKIKCEFDNDTEMNEAIHLLTPLLNSTLKVSVEWNGEKRRFERKKTI